MGPKSNVFVVVVYTLEQRWEILRHYFENHGNVAECVRKLRMDFGRREVPPAPYVRYLLKKVKETGIIDNAKHKKPSTSIHQQLNISETSLKRILNKDLGMTPHKVQLVQELKPIDHPMRFRFAKWACDRFTEDFEFGKNLHFSGEAHFNHFDLNKQNCSIWGTENPHAYIEKPTHIHKN